MKGLGFRLPKRWPTRDELWAHSERMRRMHAAAAPEPTMLGTPYILDQGNASACGGFDAEQCIYIYQQARHVVSPIGAPRFSYWNARRYDVASDADVSDSGIDPDSMIRALADFGSCIEQDCPYTDDPSGINERPGAMAYQNGQKIVCQMQPIFETGQPLVDAVKHALSVERSPVFLAIQVTPAYDNATDTNGVADDPFGEPRGGHAICCYGWDNEGLWTAGSWGRSFGRDGSVILTPRFAGQNVVYAATLEVL